MNYRRVPYLERMQSDPAHMEAVARRFVTRLTTARSLYDYRRRFMFLQDHDGRSRSPAYNATFRAMMHRAADLASQRGFFGPAAYLIYLHQRELDNRPQAESDAADLLLDMQQHPRPQLAAQNFDRSTVVDLLEHIPVSTAECVNCGGLFRSGDDGDMARTWQGDLVCNRCCDRHYRYSEYYDAVLLANDVVDALDAEGNLVEVSDADPNFEWDDDLEERVHRLYHLMHRTIRRYHSSKDHFVARGDDWTAAHNHRYIGVELEVEMRRNWTGSDRERVATAIHAAVNGSEYGKKLFFENDGSLNDGFEMITQPMSLPALRETFGFLRNEELVRPIRSHATDTCGLHVHVSRRGLSNLTIGRAVTFVHDPANEPFISALARRYNNGYCRVVPKQLDTAHLPESRYEAVNLTGDETLEFRLFRGSLRYEAVVAAVEFCHALLEFCSHPIRVAEALRYDHFLAWCAAELPDDTATLREYAALRMGTPPATLDIRNAGPAVERVED